MSTTTRKFGDSTVPAVGLGLMSLSDLAYGGAPKTDEERFAFLDAALASGTTFWDTADIYGDSEAIVGRWLKHSGKRNEIFLCTKFGFVLSGSDARNRVDGRPEYVKEAFERSAATLGVDTIDLYYYHRADKTVPIERTVAAMAELVKSGKVKYIGLSEVTASTLRRAHAIHPISAVQVEYSPFTLDIEDEKIGLLKACRELGVKIIAYAPLGRGLLAGKIRSPNDFPEGDFRRYTPRFSEENFPNILKISDDLQVIGKKHGASSGQVAIAWVIAQGEDFFAIPGTAKIKNLLENNGAGSVTLTPEEVAEVRTIAEKAHNVLGARYPPGVHSDMLFVDTPPL